MVGLTLKWVILMSIASVFKKNESAQKELMLCQGLGVCSPPQQDHGLGELRLISSWDGCCWL